MTTEQDYDPEQIPDGATPLTTPENQPTKSDDDGDDDVFSRRNDVIMKISAHLSSFPPDAFRPPFTQTLRHLYLSNNQLTAIPPEISTLDNLRTLDVTHNQISHIDENIGLLDKLTTLNLSRNLLEEIPQCVCRIASLQTLQVNHNRLATIPDQISSLPNLATLDLKYNQLCSVPSSLATMTNLIDLNLFNNKFTVFPEVLLNMPNLLTLELRNNHIPLVPDDTKAYLATTMVFASVPQKVVDGLFIGDYEASVNEQALRKNKISHVLTVMTSCERFPYPDIIHQAYNIMDDENVDIVSIFEKCHDFIEAGIKKSGVLVHCAMGISRSATIVISYLMKTRKSTFEREYDYLRSVRPIVDPNPGFVAQLKEYEKEILLSL